MHKLHQIAGCLLCQSRQHPYHKNQRPAYPPPPGSLAVYIGEERRRFVIPTRYLDFPVFTALLKSAEEEFGFEAAGGLVLPCDPDFFDKVVELLLYEEKRFRGLGIDGFVDAIRQLGFDAPDGGGVSGFQHHVAAYRVRE